MSQPYTTMSGTVILKPSIRQWLCEDWLIIMLDIACYVWLAFSTHPRFLFIFPVLVTLHLLYKLLYLRNMKFTFSEELLIHEYGVFSKRFEYVELYRVIDFHETISFTQNLLDLKTVVIYSGDRTTPELTIPGIDRTYPLVPTIRNRVENNKRRKGIYEFTNR